jgi:hypothetical protein
VFKRILPTCVLAEELKHSIVACVFGVPSGAINHDITLSSLE